MGKTVHAPKEKREGKRKLSNFLVDAFCIIFVLGVISLIIWGFITHYNMDKNYMENFYKKENSTLVQITYDIDSSWGSSYAAGYIDNEVLQKWKNGEELKENITLYNPYNKEKSFTIQIKKVHGIKSMSYKECYDNWNPEKYR